MSTRRTRRPGQQAQRPVPDADRSSDDTVGSETFSDLPDRLDTPVEVPESDLLEQCRVVPLDDDERSER